MRRIRIRYRPDQVLAEDLTLIPDPPLIDWTDDPHPGRQLFVTGIPRAGDRPCLSVELIQGTGPHGALAVIREVLAIPGSYWLHQQPGNLRKCGHGLVDLWFLVSLCLSGETRELRDATRQYIGELLISMQVT